MKLLIFFVIVIAVLFIWINYSHANLLSGTANNTNSSGNLGDLTSGTVYTNGSLSTQYNGTNTPLFGQMGKNSMHVLNTVTGK